MPTRTRREVNLEHSRVTAECPRLMGDLERADIMVAFVGEEVRARPAREQTTPQSHGAGRGQPSVTSTKLTSIKHVPPIAMAAFRTHAKQA
jgi:hypothetical protein